MYSYYNNIKSILFILKHNFTIKMIKFNDILISGVFILLILPIYSFIFNIIIIYLKYQKDCLLIKSINYLCFIIVIFIYFFIVFIVSKKKFCLKKKNDKNKTYFKDLDEFLKRVDILYDIQQNDCKKQ